MPFTYTFPPEGSSIELKCFARVDFPQPLMPRMATKLPLSMVRFKFSKTRVPFCPSRSG